jgi:hypothetical protein
MLCRLKELWGGKIYFNNRPDRPNNKPFWFWIIKGKINAYPCIKAIEPFLIVKREKAQVILQFAIDRWGDKLKT